MSLLIFLPPRKFPLCKTEVTNVVKSFLVVSIVKMENILWILKEKNILLSEDTRSSNVSKVQSLWT